MFATTATINHGKLGLAIAAAVLLMLAIDLVALYGSLGPATAYAAVPM